MMKFREKWFWALCLAILVHAGVFFILYFNAKSSDTPEMADNSTNTELPATVSTITSPPNDKVYTTTVTSTKTLDNRHDSVATADSIDSVNTASTSDTTGKNKTVNTTTNNDTPIVSLENTKKAASRTSNAIDGNTEKTIPTSKATTAQIRNYSQENKPPRLQTDDSSQPIITSADTNLENLKNNAGLLEMDVPAQKSTVTVDKDYLSAKSEVEEINDQLSSAINEVKKRNQQKIDDQHRPRNEANTEGNRNLPENSN